MLIQIFGRAACLHFRLMQSESIQASCTGTSAQARTHSTASVTRLSHTLLSLLSWLRVAPAVQEEALSGSASNGSAYDASRLLAAALRLALPLALPAHLTLPVLVVGLGGETRASGQSSEFKDLDALPAMQ
jgi:hypothetical protein